MKYKEASATNAAPKVAPAHLGMLRGKEQPWDEVLVMISEAPDDFLAVWHDAGVFPDRYLYENFFEKYTRLYPFTVISGERLFETFLKVIGMHGSIRWADSEQFGDDRPWAFLMLVAGIPGDVIATWDGHPMDKISALVVDGCPPELALSAFENDIDTSLISAV